MGTKHRVALVSEIPAGEGKLVEVEGRPIAVFNVGGSFYALTNTCPHRGGPLADGMLTGTTVTCPWHGWQFNCTTGQSTMNPMVSVPCFKASVEGAEVMIEV